MLYLQPQNEEEQLGSEFQTHESRRAFVVRVYAILFVALAATAVQCFVVRQSTQLEDFFFRNWPLIILFLLSYMICYIALVCCEGVRRSFPINGLIFFVLVESLTGLSVYITARYRNEILVYGFAITATVCILISLLAIFGPVDFTGCSFVILVLGLVTIVMGLVAIVVSIYSPSRMLFVAYSSIAVIFLSMMFAFDTQMVFGGRHYDLQEDDYMYGAVSLYVDIVQMFLNMLVLVDECFGM